MTIAEPRMDLTALVGKLLEEQDGDVLREGIRGLSQARMETEVPGLIGAERNQRSGDRTAHRNRSRTWDTHLGNVRANDSEVRPGTFVPSLRQPCRRAGHALTSGQLPGGGGGPRGGRRRHVGVPAPSGRTSAPAAQHEPTRTVNKRD